MESLIAFFLSKHRLIFSLIPAKYRALLRTVYATLAANAVILDAVTGSLLGLAGCLS